MKSSTLLLLIFTITIVGLTGCSDNGPTNTQPEIDPPTAEAFNALSDSALDARTQTEQFPAEDGVSFTSEQGVQLNIAAGCLTLNGQPANGSATLEYVELFDRSNMLVTNNPTMGMDAEGDKKLLVSGGSFFIDVTQDGDDLEFSCNSYQLIIPGDLTGGTNPDMKLWKGTTDDNGNLGWEEAADSTDADGGAGPRDQVFAETDNYFAFPSDFRPTNVDIFYSDPRPKTTLQVDPPEGYNIENSAVYLSYDGEGNALAQLDTFDENSGLFSEHYGQIPIGLEMHVIFTTEENGQWRYAIKGVTVADQDVYSFTMDETQLGSEQDLTDAINALP